jgi:uncharacterized protein YcbK (DUF882 family)
MQRRQFLALSAAVVATVAVAPQRVLAAAPRKTLSLFNAHSQETISAEYWVDGWYNPDVLQRFDVFLRDWRSNEVRPMDPKLLDILHALQQDGGGEPIHLLCGYRSRATNAMLASRSRGVARNSFHIAGRAADIRMPSISLRRLRGNAMDLAAGGVGYYPRSNFVHVDTGDFRTW